MQSRIPLLALLFLPSPAAAQSAGGSAREPVLERLTSTSGPEGQPAFSPDGDTLVFTVSAGDRNDLALLDLETGTIEAFTSTANIGEAEPAWTPDGCHIIYLAFDSLAVSPSGEIVFSTSSWGSEGDLGLFDPESGSIQQLTQEVDNLTQASWSSDGSAIVFRRNPGGWYRTSDVWTRALDGEDLTRATVDGYRRSPLWCGEYVYFHRPIDPADAGTTALWRAPAAGGEEVMVHDLPGIETPTDCHPEGGVVYALNGQVRHVVFGPSGEVTSDRVLVRNGSGARVSEDGRVAFLSTRDGQVDLYVLDPYFEGVTRITNSPWPESAPDWRPDGETIYFSMAKGDTDLWWVRWGSAEDR